MQKRYSSGLTDAQRQLIESFFELQTFHEHHPSDIVNVAFYMDKTGWIAKGQTGANPVRLIFLHEDAIDAPPGRAGFFT